MTTTNSSPTPTPEQLAQKALSTMARAEVPAGLADRAFTAAMRAEPVKPLAALFAELFAVSRFAAVGACAVAGVLVVVAVAKGGVASNASTDGAAADNVVGVDPDAWVAQVLPLATGDS